MTDETEKMPEAAPVEAQPSAETTSDEDNTAVEQDDNVDIFLHIGMPSVFVNFDRVQKIFYQNRLQNAFIKNRFLFYPSHWEKDHFFEIGLLSDFENPLHKELLEKHQISPDILSAAKDNARSEIQEEMAQRKKLRLVFSATKLGLLSKPDIRRMKAMFSELLPGKTINYRILAVVAHPSDLAEYFYHEMIMSGHSHEYALALLKALKPHRFKEKLKNYIDIFGKETMDVFPIEKVLAHTSGISGFFYEYLGFNHNSLRKVGLMPLKLETVKKGLIELGLYINNKTPLYQDGKFNKSRVKNDDLSLIKDNMGGVRALIDDKLYQKYFDQAHGDLRWLKKEFGIYYKTPQMNKRSLSRGDALDDIVFCLKNIFSQLRPPTRRAAIDYLMEKTTMSLKVKGLKRYLGLLRTLAKFVNIHKRLNKKQKKAVASNG